MSDQRAGRVLFLSLASLTSIVAILLAARLVLSVASTPTDIWLDEYTPMTERSDAGGAAPIARLTNTLIADPSVIRTLLRSCEPVAPAGETCLDRVNEGLAAIPVSGELWFQRSQLLASSGAFGASMIDALATSYALAPNEGWLAADRLPFALRIRTFLPPEMMDDVGRDIALVLTSRELAAPLVAAYIADPLFRDATFDVIEQYASFDQQEALIAWIRGAL